MSAEITQGPIAEVRIGVCGTGGLKPVIARHLEQREEIIVNRLVDAIHIHGQLIPDPQRGSIII